MKLTKRNGIWVLDYRDPMGKRIRKSLGTRDKAEAEQKAQALMTGRDPRSHVWTMAQAMDHTYRTLWVNQKSWKTRESVVKIVTAEMGHVPLHDVDWSLLEEYVDRWRLQDLAPATINRRLAAISKALNVAARKGKIAAVPPIPLQPEDNKKTRWLTDEEEVRLIARCDVLVGREMRVMQNLIAFLVDTGARLGEALKLQPEHVQGDSVLFLDTKSKVGKVKNRRVPLTGRAVAAGQQITGANRLGTMFNKSQAEKRFDRVRKAAGLADVTFHTLRHTCASRLIQRGAKLHEVREWLGHSSITVTERYAHLADSSLTHLTGLLCDGTDRVGVSTVGHSASNVAHFPRRKAR